jgi:hypothetical protein
MPLVQKYQRQVGPAPLPGVRLQAAETPESEGAGVALAKAQTAQTAANLALQLGQDAVTLEQQHEKAVAEADRTAVIGAGTQLDTFHVNLHAPDGAFSQQGVNALGLPESVKGQYDALADTLASGMTNDRQRQLFAAMRAEKLNAIMGDLLPYVSRQADAVQDDTDQRAVNAKIALGIASAGDHLKVNQSIDDAAAIVRTQAQRNGLTPEATSDALRLMQSSILEGSIKKLVSDGQPTLAQQWLDESRQAIDGTKLGGLDSLVSSARLNQQADAQANQILAEHVDAGEALDAVKKIDDNNLQDAVRVRVVQTLNARKVAAEDDYKATNLRLTNLVEAHGIGAAMRDPAWASLTESDRRGHIEYGDKLSKGQPVETDPNVFATLYRMADQYPGQFVQLDPVKYINQLSTSDFQEIVRLQHAVREKNQTAVDQQLAGFRTKDQIFNDTLAQYGISVKDAEKDPTSALGVKVGTLRKALDNRVGALESGTGKKMSNADIQDTLDGLLQPQAGTAPLGGFTKFALGAATLIGGVPGGAAAAYVLPAPSATKSLAETTLDDLRPQRPLLEQALTSAGRPASNATVLDFGILAHQALGPSLSPARIPKDQRTQLEAALRKKGQPVSDATVLGLYLQILAAGPGR